MIPLTPKKKVQDMQVEDKGMFFSMLLGFVTRLKMEHWSSRTLSEHLCFGELYGEVDEILDTLVETSQTTSLLNITHYACDKIKDGKELIKDMVMYIDSSRFMFTNTFELNLLDELQEKLNKAIYKLTFLK